MAGGYDTDDTAGLPDPATLPGGEAADAAWIEVIRKMDEVYADLVRYQVELEHKHAELEEAHGFISGVLAAMSDALVVCDSEGRIERVNPALERLTGRHEAELHAQPFASLCLPAAQPLAGALLREAEADAPVERELLLAGPGGTAVPLAFHATVRRDATGHRLGTVLAGRPVGELRRAYEALHHAHRELQRTQQQLVQSEKMASLGRLVAGVAHELNNPISFVYGNAHVLRRYEDRLRRYLGALHDGVPPAALARLRTELRIDRLLDDLGSLIDGTVEGAERVTDIVQNLRRFSSGGSGEPERYDLAEVVRTAVQWTIKGEATHALTLACELPGPLWVIGQPAQLQQVFTNLVQNALDATEGQPAPHLALRASSSDGWHCIEVTDNGPGIPPASLLRVFDPFFTTKPVGKGTGLGLSISYGLVEAAGGQLSAANGAAGGAVFTVRLPAAG
ncbi:ATP-binding protein [Plasticicumulans sp.]|uniref:sensor histidine kinase n=1 Tax=Plasticicumulans sp. TaxID=2307179 RepID=UPI002BF64630|nr:ATP-binding protein [Plasticicumulans sp.]HNM42389.1 ATP-binding protein [Plasticicumulans sp.]